MPAKMKEDAVTENQVLDGAMNKTDSGRPPANLPSPSNRRALRILALVVFLAVAGALVWAKPWITLPSIIKGGNNTDRTIALSGRIEGDDSAVASKTTGRILEVRVREGDSISAGQILAVLDDQQVRAREEQARGVAVI